MGDPLFDKSFSSFNQPGSNLNPDIHGNIPFNEVNRLKGKESKPKKLNYAKARNEIILRAKKELSSQENSLKEYSRLKQLTVQLDPLLSQFKNDEINPFRALAQTSLSYSAVNTGYESWQLKSVVKLYSNIFNSIENEDGLFSTPTFISPAIKESINNLTEHFKEDRTIEDEAVHIADKIANLAPGESYAMEGGWRGVPSGHAMIYRFGRREDGTFDLYIYNAQQGSSSVQGGIESQWRKKSSPYTYFSGITYEELFFSHPKEEKNLSLFKNWISLKKIKESEEIKSKDKMQVVFDSISHLKHRLALPKRESELFISMQRSGNCSVKTMNCMLLDLTNDHSIYKKISLDVRLRTIVAVYTHFKNSYCFLEGKEEKRDTQLFQLKEAISKYMRILDSNFKKESIGITDDQYMCAFATMMEMQSDLKDIELELNKSLGPRREINAEFNPENEELVTQKRTEYIEMLPAIMESESSKKIQNYTPLSSDFGKGISWSKLSESLNQLNEKINSLKEEDRKQDLIFQMEASLRNFSHLKNNLSIPFSEGEARRLQEQLIELQKTYNTEVLELGEVSSPAFQNTGMEFLALSYCLALAIDQKKNFSVLKDYGISTDYFFNSARQDRLFSLQDPQLLSQRQSLEAFFLKHKNNAIFNVTDGKFEEDKFLKGETSEGRFYQDYIDKSPTIKNSLLEVINNQNIYLKNYSPKDPRLQSIPIIGAAHIIKKGWEKNCPELWHIRDLEKSVLLACVAQGYYHQNPENRKAYPDDPYREPFDDNFLCVASHIKWQTNQDYIYRASYQDFSPDNELDDYVLNSQSEHQINQLSKENTLLVGKDLEQLDPNLPFYIALAEPDVQTTSLLQSTENSIERLKDKKFRKMLLHMFMKNIEKNGEIFSPFFTSFENPLMLRKIERLLSIGEKKFIDTQPETRPDLDEMLFLIRLYSRGLNTIKALNPTYRYAKETTRKIDELKKFLDKALTLPPLEDLDADAQKKKEIRAVKIGMMLGKPLQDMETNERVELLSSMINFRNELFALSSSEDPAYIRECKRRFFQLEGEWRNILKNQESCNQLGDQFLTQILGERCHLKWNFDPSTNCLSASDALGEKWTIDLLAPSLRNSKGALKEIVQELDVTGDYRRLFKDKRYDLKIFGNGKESEDFYFKSPVWGAIEISKIGDHSTIQRIIDGKYYTYLPNLRVIEEGLELNDAIFGDHALWVNLKDPNDIRFCDLETGKELYHTEKGKIVHNETGKIFYRMDRKKVDEEHQTQLSRFENLQQINGWINEKSKNKCDYLEFNRFKNQEGTTPLTFKFDNKSQKWQYSANPIYHIDTSPDMQIKLRVDHFLPLVNHDGTKRKILIPKTKIYSKGYLPLAKVFEPDSADKFSALDGQKGSIRYLEYDLGGDGSIITKNLEEKIYLAHLFLAQKKYDDALEVIQTISSSETLSQNLIEDIESLLISSEFIKDFSPNAAALQMKVFLMALHINPLIDFKNEIKKTLLENYEVYVDGLNSVEHALKLNPEEELSFIDAIGRENISSERKESLDNETFPKKVYQMISEQNDIPSLSERRKEFLLNNQIPSRRSSIIQNKISKPLFHLEWETFSNEISEIEVDIKSQSHFYIFHNLFNDQTGFKAYYLALKNAGKADSLKMQGVIYQLLFDIKHKNLKLTDKQKYVLSSVASSPEIAPEWPKWANPSLSEEEYRLGIKWYNEFKNLQISQKKTSALNYEYPKVKIEEEIISGSKPIDIQKRLELQDKFDGTLTFIEEGQDAKYASWQKEYLTHSPTNIPQSEDLYKKPTPLQLKESEEMYGEAIEKRRIHYIEDCKIARQNSESKLSFKKNHSDLDYQKLINEMKNESDRCSQHEKELLKQIDILVAKGQVLTDTPLHFTLSQVDPRGFSKKIPKLENILRAASQENGIEELLKMNQYLTREEIQELRSIAVEYMIEVTHRRHLERVYVPLEAWLKSKESGNPKKVLFEKAQDAMIEKRDYDPTKKLFPLLFEYLSDIRVKDNQANIINHVLSIISKKGDEELNKQALNIMSKKGDKAFNKCAFQLIMGGGKTSVIISMLIELISSSGSLACVMCHHSQMASVKGNLATFQKNRFDKDLFILDYSIQDLGNEKIVDTIIDRIKEAKKKGIALVMKTSLSDIIELKFYLESSRLANIHTDTEKQNQRRLVNKLAEINQIFTSSGLGIYDECDINLSIKTDVNIPLGIPKNILPERSALVKEIYEGLIDPEIKDIVGLDQNVQTEISSDILNNKIIPFLANKTFVSFKLNEKWKNAFIRYVTGKIPYKDQIKADQYSKLHPFNEDSLEEIKDNESRENVAFLIELERLYYSSDRYEHESAQLIALTRKMLCKVLKVSLSHSYNRHYGRDPKHDDGRVCPFLAVGSPATTNFGNVYMALAYQFQSALNGGISKGEIIFLAKKMTEAAQHYAEKEGKHFLEIAEAIQFKELTSVDLSEIFTEQGMEKAFQYVNDPKQLKERINLEAEVAPFHVRYYSERLTSNPINNVSRFKGAVACSGTLWNNPTYHTDFKEPYLDKGAEGSILNTLEARDIAINEIPNYEIESFFSIIKDHPNKKNLRAFVDGGGFFKGYTNDILAKKLKTFFLEERTKGGPPVKAIIYVDKFIKDGTQVEEFKLLKLDDDSNSLDTLHNTTNEEIEKKDLAPDDIFFLYDEFRSTGTDVELADDAFFFYTMDHNMIMRTELQQNNRARKFFNEQRGELIVSSKGRKEMVNQAKNFSDARATLEKNEAIALQDQISISRIAQIKDAVRFPLRNELLEADEIEREKLTEAYSDFFVSKYEDDPYLNDGRIVGEEDAKTVLSDYAKKLKIKLKNVCSKNEDEIIKAVDARVAQLSADISDDEKMASMSDEDMEVEIFQEVELETSLELEAEQEIEVNQEILNELEIYAYKTTTPAYQEQQWKLNPQKNLWEQINGQLIGVKETLARTDFSKTFSSKSSQYADSFSDSLKMTANFYHTAVEDLPLLHPHTKEAKFVLAMKDDNQTYKFVLVSEKDASFFKNWLRNHPSNGAYLVDLNGIPEVNQQSFDLEFSDQNNQNALIAGICYANLFNGNIVYLEEHPEIAKKIIPEKPDNLVRFIQLKTIRNQGESALYKLIGSKVLTFSKIIESSSQTGVIFSSRRKEIRNLYYNIQKMGENEIKKLDPENVVNISKEQVKWLQTKEQINYLSDLFINEVTPDQIERGILDQSKFHLLTKKDQVCALIKTNRDLIKTLKRDQVNHIETKDVNDLTENQIQWLNSSALIENLSEEKLIHQLTKSQVPFVKKQEAVKLLTKEQVNHVDPEYVKYLNDEQIGWLNNSSQINALPTSKIHLISEEARINITQPELMFALPNANKLEEGQLNVLHDYITNQILTNSNKIESSLQFWHASYFPQDKIPQLDIEKFVQRVFKKFVSEINEEQASVLTKTDKRLIENLKYPIFTAIQKDFYNLLTLKQINQLNPNLEKDIEILRELNEEQIGSIERRELIQKIDVNQLPFIKGKQVLLLSDEQVPMLKLKDQISNLTDIQIDLLTQHQIKEKLLSEEKISKITKNTLIKAAAESGFAEKLTSQQVRALEKEDLQYLSPQQADFINPELVNELNGKQLKGLTNAELINRIIPSKIQSIALESRKNLTKPELLFALPNAEGLTSDQLKILEMHIKDLMNDISGDVESSFKPWHTPYFPEDKISALKNDNFIQNIPEKFASKIEKEQVKKLTTNEKHLIAKLRYPVFKSIREQFYQYLVSEQINQLNPNDEEDIKILRALNVEQVVKIEKSGLLQKLNQNQIRWINKNQMQLIGKDQVSELSDKQIAALIASELINSLTPDKMKLIAIENRKNITQPELMLPLPDPQGLDEAQLNKLKEYIRSKFDADKIESKIQEWHLPYFPEDKVPMLNREDLIPLFPKQLAQFMTTKQTPHLNENNITLISELKYPSFQTIQPMLIKHLTIDQIRQLNPDTTSDVAIINKLVEKQIVQLNKNKKKDFKIIQKLNNEQFTFYHPPMSQPFATLKGIGLALFLPILFPLTMCWNLFKLTGFAFMSPFNKNGWKNLQRQTAETFINSPAKTFSFYKLFTDDIAYQREILKYTPPEE